MTENLNLTRRMILGTDHSGQRRFLLLFSRKTNGSDRVPDDVNHRRIVTGVSCNNLLMFLSVNVVAERPHHLSRLPETLLKMLG